MFYEKYKVKITGRLEGDNEEMNVFVEPWQMTALAAIALDNCKVITIDGGIRAQEPEEDDE